MNIQQALDMADQMLPNMMERPLKIAFLQEVEQLIHREIIMKHEHTPEEETCPEYNDDTDRDTELLAPDRYGMMYVYYLMSKIDMMNQEEDKEYNNRIRFENLWSDYSDEYRRNHMPISAGTHYII